jgi:hypothetical protein
MDNSFILFDHIQINESEHLDSFIDNLSQEQSLFIVKIALEHAHKKGIFSINETEVISKSIRILNRLDLEDNNQGS